MSDWFMRKKRIQMNTQTFSGIDGLLQVLTNDHNNLCDTNILGLPAAPWKWKEVLKCIKHHEITNITKTIIDYNYWLCRACFITRGPQISLNSDGPRAHSAIIPIYIRCSVLVSIMTTFTVAAKTQTLSAVSPCLCIYHNEFLCRWLLNRLK